MLNALKRRVLAVWYGKGGVSDFFLGIAVWNTGTAAINYTVWPRFYDLDVLAITLAPRTQILPIIIPLGIALLMSVGVRSLGYATAAVAVIAGLSYTASNPQSEALINHFGFRLMS